MKMTLCAYVLHKKAYGETSLIVDFFSFEQGLISGIAKGARGNTKSDRKSLLQAIQKLDIDLVGRSSLKTIYRVDAFGTGGRLMHKSLYCCFYINEVLTRALPQAEPYPRLFEQYEKALNDFSMVDANDLVSLEPILREFELTLLHELGYLPDFFHDANSGDRLQADAFYIFVPDTGFISSSHFDSGAMQGKLITEIGEGAYLKPEHKSARAACKYICRQALANIIGTKPLKSRELFT